MPPSAPVAVLVVALGLWRAGAGRDEARGPEPEAPGLAERALAEARLLEAADDEALRGLVERLAEGLAARGEDPAAAADLFHAVAAGGALADWAGALAADAHARRGDVPAMRAALDRLPADLAASWGWRAEATALIAAGRPLEAAGAARAGLDRARTAADSAEAERLAAVALLAAGDTAGARAPLRRAARAAPRTRAAREAASLLERLGVSPDDRLALVEHRVALGELEAAARTVDALGAQDASPQVRARAASALVGALAARGRLEDAERRALAALAGAPPAERAALELAVGRARLRRGQEGPAREALERAVSADARSAAAQEALFILGDLDDDAGHAQRARRRFAAAADLDPASDWGAEAAMREGLLALAAGDAPGATLRFHAYRVAHPAGWRNQQATYWAALAHLRAGEGASALPLLRAARDADPAGYYGLRAAERTGPGAADPLAGLPAPPPADPVEALLAAGALARVDALERLGLTEAAGLERLRSADLLAGRPGGLHALAEALHQRGGVVDAARAGRDARRRLGRWDVRLLRAVYPLPYGDAIVEAAESRGLDPALVAALVRQESLFQPHARSAAGAVGLMQVMPATARGLARRSGLPAPAPAALRDPAVNLTLGTLHLDDLLRASGGRVDEVLAIYNAGATRVARWRSLVPAGDADAFLERIPFRETREYVRVVQENAALYRALYGLGPERGRAPLSPASPGASIGTADRFD